jgi:hypothetical protein
MGISAQAEQHSAGFHCTVVLRQELCDSGGSRLGDQN